jgi:hypothetical protein
MIVDNNSSSEKVFGALAFRRLTEFQSRDESSIPLGLELCASLRP